MAEDPKPQELSESLFLLDGSALAYRAHFAMARSGFSSAKGIPTGATFGFTSELKRLLDKAAPRYGAVVFDTPEPTFRHEAYPEYKAQRAKTPDELVEQLPLMRDAARVLGFPVIERPGYEADDVIGTLSRRAEAQGIRVFIVTGDKDFMQLVSDRVLLYNIMKRDAQLEIVGLEEVRSKFGVPPEQVVDVLALMGDTSDNIPGAPGVGPKTAARLVNTYGSLEKVLENAAAAGKTRLRENLEAFREQAPLSKMLVTIDVEVPDLPLIEELRYRGPLRDEAEALFRELDFRTLAREMAPPRESGTEDASYTLVENAEALDQLVARLGAAKLVAVDTETTGLDVRAARIVGFSFSDEEARAWYVPLNLDPPVVADEPGSAPGSGVIERLRPFIEDTRPTKCGQNVKFDLMIMRGCGLRMEGVCSDTLIASYLIEPHERQRNLDALSLRHCNHEKIPTSSLIGSGKDQRTMDQVPVPEVAEYACEDADFTFRLARIFGPRLEELGLEALYREVEIPLIEVLAEMELAGVRVDSARLREMATGLRLQTEELREQIYAAAGEEFNPNSPRQLGEILFERLKVHEECGYRPKKTPKGAWATGQEVLEALARHPLPAKILQYRSLTKLLNTYVDILPDLVDPTTGRIHASFNQAVAATGRLSSSDPNLQNIPIRTAVGRRIREAFLPTDDDHVLLSADYSQVELRVLAHLSEDPDLIEAFQQDLDIHRDTASRIFGVALDAVDPLQRSRAKAINFGILYGMGPVRLARDTGLDLAEAKSFIERYFDAFPRIREFIEGLKDFARREGYAVTVMGRRRPIPDIGSSNRGLAAQAENMAVNTPIQGSAADILKLAMVRIARRLRAESRASRMILTVHDELVFDVPRAELEVLSDLVRSEMEGAYPLRVPLRVDMGHGPNWLEAH